MHAMVVSDIVKIAERLEGTVLHPSDCPVRDVLARISGKWTVLLLVHLARRPHRFAELRHAVPDISRRMITQSLRDLQVDGLVSRRVLPTAPPGVEYRLTPLGHSLMLPLACLIAWADENRDKVRAARRRAAPVEAGDPAS